VKEEREGRGSGVKHLEGNGKEGTVRNVDVHQSCPFFSCHSEHISPSSFDLTRAWYPHNSAWQDHSGSQ